MFMSKSFSKIASFVGGFALGLSLIAVGHAAVPQRITSESNTPANPSQSMVTEIRAKQQVQAPDLEQDYAKLSNVEARYAENWYQQQKLRSATSRVAGSSYAKAKPKKLKRMAQ
jgi:hypothetical protein